MLASTEPLAGLRGLRVGSCPIAGPALGRCGTTVGPLRLWTRGHEGSGLNERAAPAGRTLSSCGCVSVS